MAEPFNNLAHRAKTEAANVASNAASASPANTPAEPKRNPRKNATSTEHLPGWILNGWRQRAKRDTLAYELTPTLLEALWVSQRGFCAVTGRPLSIEKNDPSRVSVDRIDPSVGYTVANVRLVCSSVNYARHELTDNDLRSLLQDMVEIDRLRAARSEWTGSGHWYADKVLRPMWERVLGRKDLDPSKRQG